MSTPLRQRLVAGGAWVVAGKIATASSTLLLTFLLARVLEPSEVGLYGLAFSLVTIAAMAGQLGLHQAVVRLVAESVGLGRSDRARGAVGLAFRGAAAGNLVVGALLLAGGGALLARWVDAPALGGSIGLLVAWTCVASFQVMTSETFRGIQDLRRATLYGGVISWVGATAALGVAWVVWGSLELTHVLAVAAAATAVSLALGLLALRRRLRELPRGAPPPVGVVAAIAVPLWINGLTAFALGQVDLWLVGVYLSKHDLGVYTIVQRLVILVSTWLILVNLVVPPFIAELYARGERARLERVLRQTASLAGLPALVVLGAYVAFGGPILGLAGEEYRAGAVVLALLSFGRLVNVVTGSCGVTMSMTGHQTLLMTINLACGAATALGCWLAVQAWGVVGVAAASSLGIASQNVILWLATRWRTGLWTHVGLPRRADVLQILGLGPRA